MIKKYARLIEQRITNEKTGSTWAIQDVPNTWRDGTHDRVIADHYVFLDDGTAEPIPPNEED